MKTKNRQISLLLLFIFVAQVFFSWSYAFSESNSIIEPINSGSTNINRANNDSTQMKKSIKPTSVTLQEISKSPVATGMAIPTQKPKNLNLNSPANLMTISNSTPFAFPTSTVLPDSTNSKEDKAKDLSAGKGKNKSRRIIVKYKNTENIESIRSSVLKEAKVSKLKQKKDIKSKKIQVYELNDADFDILLDKFKKNKDVDYVQEDIQVNLYNIPSYTRFLEQWGLNNFGQSINGQAGVRGVDLNILEAWSKTKGSEDIVVGVIDTGVDINHEDLKDNIYANLKEVPGNGIDDDNNGYIDDNNGWDFVNDDNSVFDSPSSDSHGTHISGIIAAKDNDKGICGVSPNVKVMPLKFIEGTYGYTSDVIEAIEYCNKMGVKIVNCSWGGFEENKALYDAMENSQILYICAAGNMGLDVGRTPVYPACFNIPNVISVGAINNSGSITSFSNYGSNVDVAAPGSDILSAMPGNNYGLMSGTSMAAPFVTGTVALLKSLKANISINEIIDSIKSSVVKSSKLAGKVNAEGWVNAGAVINNNISEPSYTSTVTPLPTLIPTNPPSPIIFNNDQNKNIEDIIKESVDNSLEKNGKTLKPNLAEENLPDIPQQEDYIPVDNGLDGTKDDVQSQSISPLSYVNEIEPNNTSSTGMSIGSCSISGNTASSSDTDWYVINLEAGKQYKIKLAGIPTGNNLDLYAFNPSLTSIGSSKLGSNYDENITINATVSGKYYINVYSVTYNTTGSHSYQLLVYPSTNAPDSYEPNDNNITAKTISNNTAINATLNVATDDDWYVIDAAKSGKITVTLGNIPTGCDYDISVFNTSSFTNPIGGSYNGSNQSEKANVLISSPGKYYIKVYSHSGYNAITNYQLKAVVSTPDNYENNDYTYEAKGINIGNSILATIDNPNDADLFKFSIDEANTYRFELQNIPTGRDYNLYILDMSGNLYAASMFGGNVDELMSIDLNPGIYYIKVSSANGYSDAYNYRLSYYKNSTFTVSVPYISANAGDTIEIPVSIHNVPAEGISSFNFTLIYDKNVMTYTGYTPGALTNNVYASIEACNAVDGLRVLYIDHSSTFSNPIKSSGEVIRLKFVINANAVKTATVISYTNYSFSRKVIISDYPYMENVNSLVLKPGVVSTGGYGISSVPADITGKSLTTMSNTKIYGDVDADGNVDSDDYAYMRQWLIGMIQEFRSGDRSVNEDGFDVADVDADGNVDSDDYAYMRQWLIGMIQEFPAIRNAPSMPTLLNAEVNNDNQSVDLKWEVSNSTGIKEYKIYVDGELVGSSTTTNYTVTGLEPCSTYTFRVKSFDSYNYSLKSDKVATTINLKLYGDRVIDKTQTTDKTFYINSGILDLNGYNLTIKGNVVQSGGTILVNNGCLYITGDYLIQTETKNNDGSKSYGPSNGILNMTGESDYILVDGNFVTQSNKSHKEYLIAGILEVKKNFSQINTNNTLENFHATGSSKVVLSGQGSQNVSFDNSTYSMFNIIELSKPIEAYTITVGGAAYFVSSLESSSIQSVAIQATPLWQEMVEAYASQSSVLQRGVDPVTGTFTYTIRDLSIKIRGEELSFTRYYNSNNTTIGPLGKGWIHNYQGKIDETIYGGKTIVAINLPDGSTQYFSYANGLYTSKNTRGKLKKDAFGFYVYTTKDQVKYGFSGESKELAWIEDKFNNRIRIYLDSSDGKLKITNDKDVGDAARVVYFEITYSTASGNKFIQSVKDVSGRVANYKYNNSLLDYVLDHGNNKINYNYDDCGYLSYLENRTKGTESLEYNHINSHKVSSYKTKLTETTIKTIMYTYKDNNTVISESIDRVDWEKKLNNLSEGISSIAFGNNMYIAVTNQGYILTSKDGSQWNRSNWYKDYSKEYIYFSDIIWGNGLFVIYGSGNSKKYYTSPDGSNWSSNDFSEIIGTIKCNKSMFMLVPYNKTDVYVSFDAKSWKFKHINDINGAFIDIAPSEKGYVAVSETTIYYSKDGYTWSEATYDKNENLTFEKLAWGNNEYFIKASGNSGDVILKSVDGQKWNLSQTDLSYFYSGKNMVFGNGFYLYDASNSSLYKSSDGIAWQVISKRKSSFWPSGKLLFAGGKFFVTPDSGSGGLLSSKDGENWDVIVQSEYFNPSSVKKVSDYYLAVGSGIHGPVRISKNMTDWYKCNITSVMTGYNGIAYSSDKVVVVGDGCRVAYTSKESAFSNKDTNNWIVNKLEFDGLLKSVAYGNNRFVAVGDGGLIVSSANLQEWSRFKLNTNSMVDYFTINYVDFVGNMFIAVGQSGLILTSTDGLKWDIKKTNSTENLTKVVYGNKKFFVYSKLGKVLVSSDGNTWVQENCTQGLGDVVWNGIQFVGIGTITMSVQGATALRDICLSTDGINWVESLNNSNTYYSIITPKAVLWDNGKFYVVCDNNIVYYGTPESKTYTQYFKNNYPTKTVYDNGKYTNNEYESNNYGEIKSVRDINGNVITYIRDQSTGNIKKIINPDGSIKLFDYDSLNNLKYEVDEESNCTYYKYKEETYGSNKVTLLDYSAKIIPKVEVENGVVKNLEVIDPKKCSITKYDYYNPALNYNNTGMVKSIIRSYSTTNTGAGYNLKTEYSYDSYGNVASITDPQTQKVTIYHNNSVGLKDNEKTPNGYTNEYYYDYNNNLVKIVQNDKGTSKKSITRIVNDPEGNKKQVISPNLYDPTMDGLNDAVKTDTYRSDLGLKYSYNPNGSLATISKTEGYDIVYVYDIFGNVKKVQNQNQNSIIYVYDSFNRLIKSYISDEVNQSIILIEENFYPEPEKLSDTNYTWSKVSTKYLNASGEKAVTKTKYDYAGRVIEVENPDSGVFKTEYFKNGEVNRTIDIKNNLTTYYNYDCEELDGETISFVAKREPIKKDDSGTIKYRYSKTLYDKVGRKIIEKVGKTEIPNTEDYPSEYYKTSYDYYKNNNIKKITDFNGKVTDYYYDDDGVLNRQVISVLSNKTNEVNYINNYLGKPEYSYIKVRKGDISGNDISNDTKEDIYTKYEYDLNGNLVKETKPLIKNASGTFDSTPLTLDTIYSYDALDRKLSTSQIGINKDASTPSNYVTSTLYNLIGKPEYTTDANGNTNKYIYDSNGSVSQVIRGSIVIGATDKGFNKTTGTWSEENVRGYRNGKCLSATSSTTVPKVTWTPNITKAGYYYVYVWIPKGSSSTKAIYTVTYDGGSVPIQVDQSVNGGKWTSIGSYRFAEGQVGKVELSAGTLKTFADSVMFEPIENDNTTSYFYDTAGRLTTEFLPASYGPDNKKSSMNRFIYTYDNMGRLKTKSYAGEEYQVDTETTNWKSQPTQINNVIKAYKYDYNGNVIKELDALGFDEGRKNPYNPSEPIDPNKSVENIIDDGYGIHYTYTPTNMLQDVLDPVLKKESSETVKYTSRYEYDMLGRKVLEKSIKGDKNKYYYSSIGYEYDDLNNTVSTKVKKDDGADFKYIQRNYYDFLGNLIAQIDGNNMQLEVAVAGTGKKTTYEYNSFNKLLRVNYPGDDTQEAYTISYQYDRLGRLIRQFDNLNKIDIYDYDKLGRQTNHIQQKEVKDATGKDIVSETISTSYGYDSNGNKLYESDGNQNRWDYSYDEFNRLRNKKIQIKNSQNQIVSTHTTIYSYDANGNLIGESKSISDATNTYKSSSANNFVYDPQSRLIEKRDSYKTIQRLEYYNNGLLKNSFDAPNNDTQESGEPKFRVTKFKYNRNNKLTDTIEPLEKSGQAEPHVISQEYDFAGNICAKYDGRKNKTQYSYDEFDRLVGVSNDLKKDSIIKTETTRYTYDDNGNMITQELLDYDGKSVYSAITFEYNIMNNCIRRIDNGGRTVVNGKFEYTSSKVESYKYYADGKVKSKTDRNQSETTYIYRIQGWIKYQTTTKGSDTISISYEYDGNGNQTNITDSAGSIARTYDGLNRVTSKTVPNFSNTGSTYKVDYIYDIIFNKAGAESGLVAETASYPAISQFGPYKTTKVYDKVGRLKYVIDGDISQPIISTYTYYDNGSLKSLEYGNGVIEEYTYYGNNLLWTLTNKKSKTSTTEIEKFTYYYDACHNITAKSDNNGTTFYYDNINQNKYYDELNRLVFVKEPNGKTIEYSYDRAGNRETETITEKINNTLTTTRNTYKYDSSKQNRLENVSTVIIINDIETSRYTYSYGYDNNGNRTWVKKDNTILYTNNYDLLNRHISVTKPNDSIIMVCSYNAEGLRISKTANGTTTNFLYEYDKVILEKTQTQTTGLSRNIYGTNLLRRTVNSETYFYLYNGHGDVTNLVGSSNGAIRAKYYYDAFGKIQEEKYYDEYGREQSPIQNSINYAGYQYDKETGLYYLNSRMYDPITARFLQEDTYSGDINDPLSLNLYTYCHNEPLMYWDPDGHKYVRKEVAPGFFSDVYEAEYEYVRKEVVPGMYTNVYEEKYVMPVESSMESNYTPLPETSINYAYDPYDISRHMEFNTISIFDIYESATGRKISWDVGWNRITNWFSELPENLENAKDNPKDTALGIGNSVVNSGSQILNYFNSGFWAMSGNQQMADHSYRSFNSYTEKAQTYVVENHVKKPKVFQFGNQAGDIVQTIWGLKDLTKAFKSFGNVPFTPTKSLVDAGTGIPFKPSWLDDAVKQRSNIHQIKGKVGVGNTPSSMNPKDLNFSQRSVSGNVNQYTQDMISGNWDWTKSGPLKIMYRDGKWVSYDNRRLMAAQKAGLKEIPVEVVDPDAIMPGSKMTWEKAFQKRFKDVRNVKEGGVVPNTGLSSQPKVVLPTER